MPRLLEEKKTLIRLKSFIINISVSVCLCMKLEDKKIRYNRQNRNLKKVNGFFFHLNLFNGDDKIPLLLHALFRFFFYIKNVLNKKNIFRDKRKANA